jgi:hypothetical protein
MNPHGHRWAFASWLVLGDGMAEKYFAETTETDPEASVYERYRYRRDTGSEISGGWSVCT